MILRKSLRRRMSWSSFALVVMSAVLVLPYHDTYGVRSTRSIHPEDDTRRH